MSQASRVKFLNNAQVPRRDGVAYWMQASLRTRYNHALEYAVHLANHRRQNLSVFFVLTPDYPSASLRHYWFLLQGLQDVARGLHERGIQFVVYLGDPSELAAAAAARVGTLVTDRQYTRTAREWKADVAARADCPVVQVESNLVVPVETASGKQEWSAATLRRKIQPLMEEYLTDLRPVSYEGAATGPLSASLAQATSLSPLSITSPAQLASEIACDRSIPPSTEFNGGEDAAASALGSFVGLRLGGYDTQRSVPDLDWVSHLSPYLHFGHISPIEIVRHAREYRVAHPDQITEADLATFEEELVVRRELAANYVTYNKEYDSYSGLPTWAQATLHDHHADPRPAIYSFEQLEQAETSDPYWNACQHEMMTRGKMHNYMRMYWGKKILEWTQNPEEAFATAVTLNDRYQLDGRDPNGYAGVAWCFGAHDRPWVERPVFGKVRYMNANGLRRKFKGIQRYVARWTP